MPEVQIGLPILLLALMACRPTPIQAPTAPRGETNSGLQAIIKGPFLGLTSPGPKSPRPPGPDPDLPPGKLRLATFARDRAIAHVSSSPSGSGIVPQCPTTHAARRRSQPQMRDVCERLEYSAIG